MLGVDSSGLATGSPDGDGDIVDDEAEADTDAERATDGDARPPEVHETPNGAVSRRNSMSRSHVA